MRSRIAWSSFSYRCRTGRTEKKGVRQCSNLILHTQTRDRIAHVRRLWGRRTDLLHQVVLLAELQLDRERRILSQATRTLYYEIRWWTCCIFSRRHEGRHAVKRLYLEVRHLGHTWLGVDVPPGVLAVLLDRRVHLSAPHAHTPIKPPCSVT